MEWRFEQVCKYCAELFSQDIAVYSPIVHNHSIAIRHQLPRTWEFWQKIDIPMLDICDELRVFMLPGWEKSIGVTAEINHAAKLGKLIQYIQP